eukprot:12935416-Heterocapsa_arctica.AAC.1
MHLPAEPSVLSAPTGRPYAVEARSLQGPRPCSCIPTHLGAKWAFTFRPSLRPRIGHGMVAVPLSHFSS